MAELRFAKQAEQEERETRAELVAEGGISYREEIDERSGEKKKFVNILGIEIPTYATEEEIDELKSPENLILSPVDQKMLRAIAECYKLKQPLLFEGDPGIGKTFLFERFTQFVHGKDAPILSLVGTPRTSELEILGHWAPRGRAADEEKLGEITTKLSSQPDFVKLRESLNGRLTALTEKMQKGEVKEEEFQRLFGEITADYAEEAKKVTIELAKTLGVSAESEWEFKRGALLQAYSGRNGDGQILIVDEFNLIPSNFQQIFLQIGGKDGGLSKHINFFGNSGKTQYKRGKDAWVGFAMNSPETTPGRGEVVAPMTDRLVWQKLNAEDAKAKKSVVTLTAGGRLAKRTRKIAELKPETMSLPAKDQLIWNEVLDEALGEQIADTVHILNEQFIKMYEDLGDTIEIKGEKRRRTQQLEFSGRNALRLFAYLDQFQVRDQKTGVTDFPATLRAAFKRHYVDRLASADLIAKAWAIFDGVVSGTTGKINFEGKPRDRKDVLNILAERASLTAEDKLKMEEEDREAKKRRQAQMKNNVNDRLSSLLNNPNVSDDLKKRLGQQ